MSTDEIIALQQRITELEKLLCADVTVLYEEIAQESDEKLTAGALHLKRAMLAAIEKLREGQR
jgi:hypothetical protein